jgi:O-succinylbenzoate synthase
MKIERVTIRHLRMDLRTPFETSFGRISTRECILIEVYADGIIGIGECSADRDPGYSYETTGTAWHILLDFIIPAVLDHKFSRPSDLYERIRFVRGHNLAKAGLEMALWDWYGKSQSRSLRDLLGGTREKVDVGVSIGIQRSTRLLLRVVDEYLNKGYRRIKIKIKPGRDVEDTRAVRDEFPHHQLQVDANSAYTLETAKALIALDDLKLLLIEQPLNEDDLWDHRQLQAQFRTPICLDESILSPRHARQALEMDSCRIINIKAGRVGGITQAVRIHDLCRSKNIPVWCGGMLETGVGRAANLALAALPGFLLPGDISATERYYSEDITKQHFTLNADSTITVPGSPGLGVELDRESLTRVTLASATVP